MLGGLVGVIASVLANLATPYVSGYLSRKKSTYSEMTKRKATETYRLLVELHSGKQDKYLFFMTYVMHTIVSLTGLLISVIVIAVVVISTSLRSEVEQLSDISLQGALAAVATYFVFRANERLNDMRVWRWRLDHFETYQNNLKKEYGELPTIIEPD